MIETDHLEHRPRNHLVQFYEEEDELAHAVATYLKDGVQRGEGILIIAKEQNREAFMRRLEHGGIDLRDPDTADRVLLLDATSTLESISVDGRPDRTRFRNVIFGTVDKMIEKTGAPRIRAYGEMVDLLWGRGDLENALRLEGYWNHLLHMRPVTLLCGYRMSLLNAETGTVAIEEVCSAHSHVRVAEERARLDDAVERAVTAELGTDLASRYRPLIDALVLPNGSLGRAERTLFWLRRNLPERLDTILARARRHYDGGI